MVAKEVKKPMKRHRRQQSIEDVLETRLQRIMLLRHLSSPRKSVPDRRLSRPETIPCTSCKTMSRQHGDIDEREPRSPTLRHSATSRSFQSIEMPPPPPISPLMDCASPASPKKPVRSQSPRKIHHSSGQLQSPTTPISPLMDEASPVSPQKPRRTSSKRSKRRNKTIHHSLILDNNSNKSCESPKKPVRSQSPDFRERRIVNNERMRTASQSRFSPHVNQRTLLKEKALSTSSLTTSPKKPLRSHSPARYSASSKTTACTETPSPSKSSSRRDSNQKNVLDHSAHQREQLELLSTQVDKFCLCEL